jgi:hypothetical protein
MHFSVEMILDRISGMGKIHHRNRKFSNEIFSAKMLSDTSGPLEEGILYVIPYDTLPNQSVLPEFQTTG